MKKQKLLFSTAIITGCLMISACTPSINTRGNLVSDSKLQQVQPNVTTQYDVTEKWGPPTFVAPFEEAETGETWYYAGHTSERMGVFKYEITERKLIQVDFDENGIVTDVQQLNPDMAQNVDFVDRQTPTAGKEFTILQQLVGNIGRFNGVGTSANKAQSGNN